MEETNLEEIIRMIMEKRLGRKLGNRELRQLSGEAGVLSNIKMAKRITKYNKQKNAYNTIP